MREAQRLADQLNAFEASGLWYPSSEAAAELRRLDAVESKWAALSQDGGKAQREIERLMAVNAQLLGALKKCADYLDDTATCLSDMAVAASARAAIQAATGETK